MKIETEEVATSYGVVTVFRIINSKGAFVELTSIGAGIRRLVVPDEKGVLTDVALYYADVSDYFFDSPCAGKTPGRYAGRIAGARLQINGNEYLLTKNDGENSLHGGKIGFQNRIWKSAVKGDAVMFDYLAQDGEEGYPGNIDIHVVYSWDEENRLTIEYTGVCDADTVLNLTNHTYFNLNGIGVGNCLDHMLMLGCRKRLPSDSYDIPTGEIAEVKGTPFDFTLPTLIGEKLGADFENLRVGKGYNHYFFIDCDRYHGIADGAVLRSLSSGIIMTISTSLPGLVLYTGNWLDDSPIGAGGCRYRDHDGVAIECQYPPDAPNNPAFPSTILTPGNIYHHKIIYRFTNVHKP